MSANVTPPGGGILCPKCGGEDSTIRDSRPAPTGWRRRRICTSEACGRRFTTFEIVVGRGPTVIVPATVGTGYRVFDLANWLAGLEVGIVEAIRDAFRTREAVPGEEDDET